MFTLDKPPTKSVLAPKDHSIVVHDDADKGYVPSFRPIQKPQSVFEKQEMTFKTKALIKQDYKPLADDHGLVFTSGTIKQPMKLNRNP